MGTIGITNNTGTTVVKAAAIAVGVATNASGAFSSNSCSNPMQMCHTNIVVMNK